jgi:hypothetical protein
VGCSREGEVGSGWASGWGKKEREEGVLAHAGERGGKRAGLGQRFELGCPLLFSFLFFFFSFSILKHSNKTI